MTSQQGYKGKVDLDIGQGGTFTTLPGARSVDFNPSREQVEDSELEESGMARTGVRTDADATVSTNWDPANQSMHRDLLDAVLNDTLIDVRIYPDASASFYYEFTAKCGELPLTIDGSDVNQVDVTLNNGDGEDWGYTT